MRLAVVPRPRTMLSLLPLLLAMACGGDDSDPGGGSGGAGSAGKSAGGSSGSAGKSGGSVGGSAGTAGAAGSTAGASGTSGQTGAGTGGTAGTAGTSGASGQSGAAGTTAGAAGDAGAAGATAGTAGAAGTEAAGGAGAAGEAGNAGAGGATDPCVAAMCKADQKCVLDGTTASCVDLTCADLTCKPTEECVDPTDAGASCVDISCQTDLDCPTSRFCDKDAGVCKDDTCTPGATKCQGQKLLECSSNGSASTTRVTCGSPALSSGPCVDAGDGNAYCPCTDDWDCPAFQTCEAGACQGTGKAPTCSLPPVDFTSVLPKQEIHWGGTGQGATKSLAVNSPFPTSSQSSATPLVANLDDDNGDGLIDERDTPEIIFMTYCGTDISTNGTIRAIHGGGKNKGKDYFASAGTNVWHEGNPLTKAFDCATAIGNSTSAMAVADLDGNGVPEIVVVNESRGVTILDNKGDLVTQSANSSLPSDYAVPAVTVANLDGKGFAEIVVGHVAFTLGQDASKKLVFVDTFNGGATYPSGKNGQGPIACVADLTGDARLEVVAGSTLFALPAPPAGVTRRSECAVGATDDFCTGKLSVVWDAQQVNGTTKLPNAQRDGFCAVADVLGKNPGTSAAPVAPGPANPLDGKPEIVLINEGTLIILESDTGKLLRYTNLNAGADGGAPNVDDFDGDGFPEIGTAFGTGYLLIDLQDTSTACPAWPGVYKDGVTGNQGNPARNPGPATCTQDSDCAAGAVCSPSTKSCTCLHNGWRRETEDDSSRVTGSSVFDFNGDGAAEVVYGDECFLRVYDGRSGQVLFKQPATSRTRIENPVIADIDNDGNAEIINATNNDANACSAGNDQPNGITVWGDASDAWVSARRIWNQHAYHVTNITESAAVPIVEPSSWKSYNGRSYNVYRSNPRMYDVAPDLSVSAVQLSSPDAACGTLSKTLQITTSIANLGDLRVGAGLKVTFHGIWNSPALSEPLYADSQKTPLTTQLPASLDPKDSVILSVVYQALNNSPGTLPDKVRVVVDEDNAERECKETNNELTRNVAAGDKKADLSLALATVDASGCPSVTVPTTVTNQGSLAAKDVVVRFYAGDPDQGGTALQDEVFAGSIAPFGGTASQTVTIANLPQGLSIQIFGRVDPDNAVDECNDGNNTSSVADKVACGKI